MTTTNMQVKLLMKMLKKHTKEAAAAKAGMDVKTARKYIKSGQLPSEQAKTHNWKTHADVFSEDWPMLEKMLVNAPGLQAKTLMEYLLRLRPEHYHPKQLRTLQRRIRDWRALYGEEQAIIFNQAIQPGKQSQSDFTCMNSLSITINGQYFKHLLFHFMLPFSHWESIYVCQSERFDHLVKGFEKAVWELGYVAKDHRTDNLTAATQAMGSGREFTQRWQQFMAHYGITPTTNNVGVSHENGSVEKSHDTLKTAIDQALMIRGYRDFPSEKHYIAWLEELVKGRNAYRLDRLAIETKQLSELPNKRWHAPEILQARVSSASIIQLLGHPYSVPSRLIHYTLKAYIYPDEIHLYYGKKAIQKMPRAYNGGSTGINYRHLIDGLVRKPGAFANYRYQEAFFPQLCFRQAYDTLRRRRPASADKCYLYILQLCKIQSEQEVAMALSLLLEANELPTASAIKELVDTYHHERRQVHVDPPNLSNYDTLLTSYGLEKEEKDGV